MLFIKYISDVWKDHYEEFKKKYNENEARLRRISIHAPNEGSDRVPGW